MISPGPRRKGHHFVILPSHVLIEIRDHVGAGEIDTGFTADERRMGIPGSGVNGIRLNHIVGVEHIFQPFQRREGLALVQRGPEPSVSRGFHVITAVGPEKTLPEPGRIAPLGGTGNHETVGIFLSVPVRILIAEGQGQIHQVIEALGNPPVEVFPPSRSDEEQKGLGVHRHAPVLPVGPFSRLPGRLDNLIRRDNAGTIHGSDNPLPAQIAQLGRIVDERIRQTAPRGGAGHHVLEVRVIHQRIVHRNTR